VQNVGTGASGSWYLNAVLPTSISNERVYNSQAQPSINPGQSYQMTLAFDSYDPSTSSIQITLQGGNDTNRNNNILVIPLTSNGNSANNNGCYYQNGYQYCNGNNNNGCYYSNGSYICNNNNNNNCYYLNGSYVCNNNNNNGCYYSNGSYICNTGNNSASDLSVTITNVGTLDKNTGQFYYTNSISRTDRAAVQFEVKNTGGTSSGSWSFTANLPSSSNSSYSSGTQNSLAAGQTMSFTVGFDGPNGGSQNVSVQLYPSGSDSNSGNNYASRSIYVNN